MTTLRTDAMQLPGAALNLAHPPACRSPTVKGYRVCQMHGAAVEHRKGKWTIISRLGGRTKEAIDASGYINALTVSCVITTKSLPQVFGRHVIAIGFPALITPVA